MTTAQAGDVVQLVGRDHKHFILRLTPGQQLHTHRGIFEHDALIGRTLGTEVFTHRGDPFFLLQPSTDDLIREIKRNSQIIYPKDIGFILMKLSVRPGVTVVEAGTGSGGLTTVLAQAVGPTGCVISYEVREDMQNLARKNLERVGLADRITFKLRDIAEGFDETDVYALFLDVPNPWDYTGQAYRALQSGGFFGSLVPTANQVSELLVSMRREGFDFVEVCEVLLRYYKPVPDRLRPTDRMVAHTGFLIFGRPVIRSTPPPETLDAQDETDDPDLAGDNSAE
ncbi:MAG: tRNA ((58)-N(1))-methyltransferase TrmI [Anaerolineales bacterium]|jgi:tRNA (adenine57-N1/adenine58-N1)-methyltransferase|nr:tRNA ((58)-N(1))-methyltransferase TrmI [Anaerolineales bacterium]MBM2847796.1 tRNA ((58)-N(1))-methyltransferase TrmI [Anaerolineales bacterium]